MDPFATRTLGSTGVRVTALGLGTGPLGGWPTAVSREQAAGTLQRAWDSGIRYFDTAPMYGHGLSEEHVGAALAARPRSEFTLSTKIGRLLVEGEVKETLFEGIPDRFIELDYSYDGAIRSLEESRSRLGIDTIDIALIHDPDDHPDEALAGAYQALADLRADGVIRAVGLGMNWSGPLARFIEAGDFDCVLCAGRYTILEQDSLDDLLPAALARNVSVIAAGVYNSGLLIEPGPRSTYNYEPAPPGLIDRALAIKAVCDDFGVPLRAAAVQFPLAHPAVATVITGSRTADEVDDTIRNARLSIPPGLWSTLQERGLLREDAPVPAP